MNLKFKIEVEEQGIPMETLAKIEMSENQEIVLKIGEKKITIKILTE